MSMTWTTKGWIEDNLLEKRVIKSNIPCGLSIQTDYYWEGELVRRDQLVEVDKGLNLTGKVNTVQKIKSFLDRIWRLQK